jgi:hypothetical protein
MGRRRRGDEEGEQEREDSGQPTHQLDIRRTADFSSVMIPPR